MIQTGLVFGGKSQFVDFIRFGTSTALLLETEMHGFHNHRQIWVLRLCSLCYVAMMILFAAGAGIAFMAVLESSQNIMKWVIAVMSVWAFFALLFRITASAVSCPMCMNKPLGFKRCSKHIRAKPVFGSYRLTVVSSVLLRNQFLCPHCGQSIKCHVRDRRKIENMQRQG